MFLNNFLIMTMTTHTANWLATRSATHGQRTTTAVSDSKRESQRQRESFNFTENERESEAIKRARERAARVWNSGASYDANGRAKQSSKQGTHRPYAEGGKSPAEGRERESEWESKIYIGQLPTLTHTNTHTPMQMLIVLKRGENEMQRNEWAAQNVRNKMEAGTWK